MKMNNIEEYDAELRRDITYLEQIYEKDKDFDKAELRAVKNLSDEEIDKIVNKMVIGRSGRGINIKRRLLWAKQLLGCIEDFSFRATIIHSKGFQGLLPAKIYTKDKMFDLSAAVLTKEERREISKHIEESIMGSSDPTLSNYLSYPSLGLMRFIAKLLEKYGAEKLQ
jgi:hypothetical protein